MKKNGMQNKLEEVCRKKGIKLTPLRTQVFTLIHSNNKPITAYELLRKLREMRATAEPPTVYRVLEFLQFNHLIHRIETSNSYVICINPNEHSHSQLFLCISCGATIEADNANITEAIKACAKKYRFILGNDLTEIRGQCANCAKSQN